jgi:tetratricopeptide (TPR) repeat protein
LRATSTVSDQNDTEAMGFVQAARQAAAQGQFQRAAELAVEALERDPDCLPGYLLIAQIQMQHGNWEPAGWAIGEALRLQPDSAPLHFDAAKVHRLSGRIGQALEEADRTLSLDDGLPHARAFRIEVLNMLGRYDQADRALLEGLSQNPGDVDFCLLLGDSAARLGRVAEAIERLEACLPQVEAQPGVRCDVLFRLAALHDKAGQYDRAFAAARTANGLVGAAWDPDAHDRSVAALMTTWSAAYCAAAPRASNDGRRALFIVGLPRSGTSLVEQILASHSRVTGGGELSDLLALAYGVFQRPGQVLPFEDDTRMLTAATLAQLGAQYLDRLASLDGDAAIVTDKMPANFTALGLVQQALPGARVIHCVRDPRDACLSSYFTHFREGNQFSCDLGHLGRYARAEQRLMCHWQEVLDLPILPVRYESLVANLEQESRRLLAFAGLDWQPSCLRFHESERIVDTASAMQVRQPVYASSVGRYRHYARHLAPLLAGLGLPQASHE